MSRETTLKRILDGGIVAVVRAESSESLVKVVKALADGGVTAAEITFTVPDAVEVIRQVRREVGDAVVLGAGTVLDPETARAALLAGAEYIVAPDRQPRRHPPLPPLRQGRDAGSVHADRGRRGLGSRRRRRQDLPGRRRRPTLPQGPARPACRRSG